MTGSAASTAPVDVIRSRITDQELDDLHARTGLHIYHLYKFLETVFAEIHYRQDSFRLDDNPIYRLEEGPYPYGV